MRTPLGYVMPGSFGATVPSNWPSFAEPTVDEEREPTQRAVPDRFCPNPALEPALQEKTRLRASGFLQHSHLAGRLNPSFICHTCIRRHL